MFSRLEGSYGRRKKKAGKKKTDNCFEEQTDDQLQQLCKAAKLSHAGTKPKLVERLCQDEILGPRGCKCLYIRMDQLKDYCRVRSLPVAGSRFDLILRIIQYDKDAKESASSQKRKADSSGGPPKKKSTAAAETPDLTDAATT